MIKVDLLPQINYNIFIVLKQMSGGVIHEKNFG